MIEIAILIAKDIPIHIIWLLLIPILPAIIGLTN
jgi:hypothetical protein